MSEVDIVDYIKIDTVKVTKYTTLMVVYRYGRLDIFLQL